MEIRIPSTISKQNHLYHNRRGICYIPFVWSCNSKSVFTLSTATNVKNKGSDLVIRIFSWQVRISVQASRCHSDTIRLEIIRNKPYMTPDTDLFRQSSLLLKNDLVKEVTRSVEEAQLAQEVKVNVIQEDDQKYCQTKGRSLYTLLEEIRDLALLDVSNSYGVWSTLFTSLKGLLSYVNVLPSFQH